LDAYRGGGGGGARLSVIKVVVENRPVKTYKKVLMRLKRLKERTLAIHMSLSTKARTIAVPPVYLQAELGEERAWGARSSTFTSSSQPCLRHNGSCLGARKNLTRSLSGIAQRSALAARAERPAKKKRLCGKLGETAWGLLLLEYLKTWVRHRSFRELKQFPGN